MAVTRRAERQRILTQTDRVLQLIFAARNAVGDEQEKLAQLARQGLRELQMQLDLTAEEYYRHARKTLQAIGYFVGSLGPLPGRKAVVYIGEGLPMRPAEELYIAMDEVFRGGRELSFRRSQGGSSAQGTGSGTGSDSTSSGSPGSSPRPSFSLSEQADAASALMRSQRRSLSREVRELIALANSSQVSFYTLKTKGRSMRMADVGGTAGLVSSASVSAARDSNLSATLDFMAADTGGTSSHGADTDGLIVRALRDFDEHYSLGYSPAHHGDGKYHEVKVKVRRRGVEVRHRSGYEDKPRDEKLADRTAAELVFDLVDNPHGIIIEPLSSGEKNEEGHVVVPARISIPLGKVTLLPKGDRHVCTGKVFIAVMSPNGDIEPVRGFGVSFGVPTKDLEPALSESYLSEMKIPTEKGARSVAVGFWDSASGWASFAHAEIGGE